jgi:hypothetical protein
MMIMAVVRVLRIIVVEILFITTTTVDVAVEVHSAEAITAIPIALTAPALEEVQVMEI